MGIARNRVHRPDIRPGCADRCGCCWIIASRVAGMTLRITPIAPRPVRTERDYRRRREAEKQAALHEKLMREVKEKTDVRRDA